MEIQYQFIPVPSKLFYCLDNNCKSMLFALIDLANRYNSNVFFRTNEDLQNDACLSKNLVIATLDTLYQTGLINIECIGQARGRKANTITVYFDKFLEYEQYTFEEVRKKPELFIKTVKYKGTGFAPSYTKKSSQNTSQQSSQKVNTILDTIDTLNSLETEYTKEYNNTKETTLENNITKEGDKISYTSSNTLSKNEDKEIDNKTPSNIEYYLDSFLSNPSADYSSIITNISYFKQRYSSDLDILKDRLLNKCNYNTSIGEIINLLQDRYVLQQQQYYNMTA